ncbi:hypothetical protein PNOK_0255500 [Pyrrhoderma noxium]|uniref:Uncharacterized protein n=1 Tax=Pyrrhoderma noxium TaxID=2282107 RepID=A0A286USN8_9AGAM|nr:hypothetical protein PNOK_0255500 [Pyrrhoderma noxium]
MNTSVPSGDFPIVFKRQHSSAPAKGRHSILDAEAYAPMIYFFISLRPRPELQPISVFSPTIDITKNMNRKQGGKGLIRLTKNLSTVISSPFRRRRYLDSMDNITLASSEMSSECSTLVEFVVHDSEASLPESPRAPPGISEEYRYNFVQPSASVEKVSPSDDQDLLDEEDCTWVMPRSKRHNYPKDKSKIKQKVLRKPTRLALLSVTDNDLLDSDDRSWV